MFEPKTPELNEYLSLDGKQEFPEEISIALAVCTENCATVEFIVDGSTQVCQHCGSLMFRTQVKKYRLTDEDGIADDHRKTERGEKNAR